MSQKSKSGLITPNPYQMPGYTGIYPQLDNQHHLLTSPSKTRNSHPMLPSIKQPQTQGRIELPKLPSNANIPSVFPGQLPVLQDQRGTVFSHMQTHKDASSEDIPSLLHAINLLKTELSERLQRKVISGYAGFIPRARFSMGISYVPGVQACMDEFDLSQVLYRFPTINLERHMKQTYGPKTTIYSPAGLLPNYTGFIPGFRDSFGSTFGNASRQLYSKHPL